MSIIDFKWFQWVLRHIHEFAVCRNQKTDEKLFLIKFAAHGFIVIKNLKVNEKVCYFCGLVCVAVNGCGFVFVLRLK